MLQNLFRGTSSDNNSDVFPQLNEEIIPKGATDAIKTTLPDAFKRFSIFFMAAEKAKTMRYVDRL